MPDPPAEIDRSLLRHLPPVETVLKGLKTGPGARLTAASRKRLCRTVLDYLRSEIEEGAWAPDSRREASQRAIAEVKRSAKRILDPHPLPVINATGVLLHTNLGRAPLATEARRAVESAASSYSDLEYDLESGGRGSRLARVGELLGLLTGAEAALAVNNNAAAVLLALNTMATGKEVIVSRGHLVEIGGSFRMPAIMEKSGGRMVEVGTTNKTHLRDYAQAIGRKTGLILNVHQSNFAQVGFVKQVPLEEMVELGNKHGIPVMDDQGSGILSDPGRLGAPLEPTVIASLEAGAAIVTASGDKLLGGPQAGIIMGERDWVERMKANPLARALRLDKMQLAALEETVRLYLTGVEDESVPVRSMATATLKQLKQRAEALREAIKAEKLPLKAEVARTSEVLGGGSSPDVAIPGWGVALSIRPGSANKGAQTGAPKSAQKDTRDEGLTVSRLERELRNGRPPVIARVSEEQVILDIRSVFPAQDGRIPRLLAAAVMRLIRRHP
jgi:L-seryl-tRNA(Ser) seleniumtransferase